MEKENGTNAGMWHIKHLKPYFECVSSDEGLEANEID